MNRFALSPLNFDQLVQEIFQPRFLDPGLTATAEKSLRKVPVNIQEDDEKYTLSFLTPGVPKEAIRIDLDEKNEEQEDQANNRKVLKQEFQHYAFKRSFSLNERVDREAITAQQENGILTITLPKKEEHKPEKKTILIA